MAAVELIERANWTPYLKGVAVHESGHYVGAKRYGCKIRACWVRPNAHGRTEWSEPDDVFARAVIPLCGPAAHMQFYEASPRGRTLFDFVSPADEEIFEEAAAIAEPDPANWFRRATFIHDAAADARKFIRRQWPEVKRVARQIIAADGVLLAEVAPPAPAPKPAPDLRAKRERLLREAMEHIWGGGEIYP